MREKLIEFLQQSFEKQYEKRELLIAEYTADDLLSNGVIVLPCKVGDTVWLINGGIVTGKTVEKIELHRNGDISLAYGWRNMGYELKFMTDIGKTVFLTREEAEAALKEVQG